MKYLVKMYYSIKDEAIELEVNASNVFDAIDIAADSVEHPEDVILEEAYLIER